MYTTPAQLRSYRAVDHDSPGAHEPAKTRDEKTPRPATGRTAARERHEKASRRLISPSCSPAWLFHPLQRRASRVPLFFFFSFLPSRALLLPPRFFPLRLRFCGWREGWSEADGTWRMQCGDAHFWWSGCTFIISHVPRVCVEIIVLIATNCWKNSAVV